MVLLSRYTALFAVVFVAGLWMKTLHNDSQLRLFNKVLAEKTAVERIEIRGCNACTIFPRTGQQFTVELPAQEQHKLYLLPRKRDIHVYAVDDATGIFVILALFLFGAPIAFATTRTIAFELADSKFFCLASTF